MQHSELKVGAYIKCASSQIKCTGWVGQITEVGKYKVPSVYGLGTSIACAKMKTIKGRPGHKTKEFIVNVFHFRLIKNYIPPVLEEMEPSKVKPVWDYME